MIADLKKQLADGKLKDESQIKDAIKEAAKDYDLKLSDDDIAKLTSTFNEAKGCQYRLGFSHQPGTGLGIKAWR